MMQIVRLYENKDFDMVFNLQNESIMHPWTKEMMESSLKQDNMLCIVHEENSKIDGYLLVSLLLDEAEVLSIAVDKNKRKCGIASEMMEYLIKYFNDSNIQKAFLEVRSTNTYAIKLYEKYDFKQISVRKCYYHNPIEDGIVMMLKL